MGIEKLAQASGLTLKHDQHTEGGWTLEKHWNSQTTISKIHQGNWDVVVIQEYSTRTSEKPQDICQISFPYAKKLAEEVHQYNPNAKIQWYLTWGRPFGGMQNAITETYTTYGCMFKAGQVAPVGEGFREYKKCMGMTLIAPSTAPMTTMHHYKAVICRLASILALFLTNLVLATLMEQA